MAHVDTQGSVIQEDALGKPLGQTEDGVAVYTCLHGQQGASFSTATGQILGRLHKPKKLSACYNRAWILRGQD